MKISLAERKDLPSILQLQRDCYLEEAEVYNDFSIPPLTQTLESLEQDFKNQIILKMEIEGRVVGSVRGKTDIKTCSVGRLIVHKDFRKRGLGTLLMNEIESQFDSVERFELFTGHRSEKNITLYKKLGYAVFRKQKVNEKLELIFLEKYRSL